MKTCAIGTMAQPGLNIDYVMAGYKKGNSSAKKTLMEKQKKCESAYFYADGI